MQLHRLTDERKCVEKKNCRKTNKQTNKTKHKQKQTNTQTHKKTKRQINEINKQILP